MNKILKVIHKPSIILKKIEWIFLKRKFGYIGKKIAIGNNCIFNEMKNIYIGNNFMCGDYCKILTWEKYNNEKTNFLPKLIIGNNVSLNERCTISCLNKIEIGDGVLFGDNVFITDNSHGNNTFRELLTIPRNRKLFSKGTVKIGKNVWIGRNVCILPNTTIGDNAIIGANAVVTHDVPDNSIVAGIPAVVIRKIEN